MKKLVSILLTLAVVVSLLVVPATVSAVEGAEKAAERAEINAERAAERAEEKAERAAERADSAAEQGAEKAAERAEINAEKAAERAAEKAEKKEKKAVDDEEADEEEDEEADEEEDEEEAVESEKAEKAEGDGVPSRLQLYDLEVLNITEGSVDIAWKTSRSATYILSYWPSSTVTIRSTHYAKAHLVHLDGLESDTTYYFKITCKDRHDMKRSVTGEFTTATPKEPPKEPEEEVTPKEGKEVPPKDEEEWPIVPMSTEPPWKLTVALLAVAAVAVGGVLVWLWRKQRKTSS